MKRRLLPSALARALSGRGLGTALVIGGQRIFLAVLPLALVLLALGARRRGTSSSGGAAGAQARRAEALRERRWPRCAVILPAAGIPAFGWGQRRLWGPRGRPATRAGSGAAGRGPLPLSFWVAATSLGLWASGRPLTAVR